MKQLKTIWFGWNHANKKMPFSKRAQKHIVRNTSISSATKFYHHENY